MNTITTAVDAKRDILPQAYAQQFRLIFVNKAGEEGFIAALDTPSKERTEEIIFFLGSLPGCHIVSETEFQDLFKEVYGSSLLHSTALNIKLNERRKPAESDMVAGQTIVKTAKDIINAAIANCASDIHVESFEDHLRIRFRIDGRLIEHCVLPAYYSRSLVSRLKIMSGLDIAEKTPAPGWAHQNGRYR